MSVQTKLPGGSSFFDEMKEFATFSAASQRYIRRSLDVGLGRRSTIRRWARTSEEAESIRIQALIYERIDALRAAVLSCEELLPSEELMEPLLVMTAYDLAQDKLDGFAGYRFLYERLLGAAFRPWLLSAFCGAAALPHIHPEARRDLLRSVEESAALAVGWSIREPQFMPEWVEKVDTAAA